jgi:hypothetical protein
MLAGRHKPDMESRRAYATNHSWQVRAQEFLKELTPIIAAKSRGMAILTFTHKFSLAGHW